MELAAAHFDGVLCHPQSRGPQVGLASARRVGLPISAGSQSQQAFGLALSKPEPIEAKPVVSTHVVLEVAPQNDVLVQLLDQQVPHPDQLLALARFAAQEQPFTPAAQPQERIDSVAETILPTAAASAIAPAYQLASASARKLSLAVAAHAGSFAGRAGIAEIPVQASLAMLSAVMPAAVLADTPVIAETSNQVGIAGLCSLPAGMLKPAPGILAGTAAGAAEAEVAAEGPADVAWPSISPDASVTSTPGSTNLLRLPSDLVLPASGILASPTADPDVALDQSSAVSGDLAMPGFSRADVAGAGFTPQLTAFLPLPFGSERTLGGEAPQPQPIVRLIAQTFETHPVVPSSRLEPMDRKPPEDALRAKGTGVGAFMRGHGLEKLEPAWAHAAGFLQHAPRDLKILMFAIPVLLALVHTGLPRVAFAAPQSAGGFPSQFKKVLSEQLVGVRQSLEHRAAIALDEDFRSGLDNWASPGNSTTEWSFDQSGFVQPGPLALYRPSVMLADYQVQFMGLIDKKALSWVVRAADFENFYVVKLVVTKSGPIPAIGLTRYAVINGKAEDRHDVNIPLSARADTLYNIRMDVRGANFNVEIQGQMADSWTEKRLTRGGVGFFTARGEASRVRWVQITHQYDMLGRLCAYLAPYDTTNGSWQP